MQRLYHQLRPKWSTKGGPVVLAVRTSQGEASPERARRSAIPAMDQRENSEISCYRLCASARSKVTRRDCLKRAAPCFSHRFYLWRVWLFFQPGVRPNFDVFVLENGHHRKYHPFPPSPPFSSQPVLPARTPSMGRSKPQQQAASYVDVSKPLYFSGRGVGVRVRFHVLDITDPGEKSIHFPTIPVSGIREHAPAHQQADGFRFPPLLGQPRPSIASE